jgi:SAM-dependent methyltransferase
MFFDDPVAAFANIAAALGPNGRVVLLCWRELARNEWVRELRAALAASRDLPDPPPDAPSPFAFAEAERVRGILGTAGLARVTFDPLERPMYFGPDPQGAFLGVTKLSIVRNLLADLDEKRRQKALDRLRETVERHQTPAGVLFDTSAWLVRATTAREDEGP